MKFEREILRFCVILSMLLMHFHFQKSWWHKKKLIVCHIISENGIELTLHVAKPFVKKITKFNEARRNYDAIKWKHFLRHWPFVRGIHWSPVNSPHKGQWRGTLMLSLICAWIDGWVNNREAGWNLAYMTLVSRGHHPPILSRIRQLWIFGSLYGDV